MQTQKEIKVLDCTLRDGGYVNDWKFKNKDIVKTINGLQAGNIDVIECGFLDSKNGLDCDCTRFETFEVLNTLLLKESEDRSDILRVAMVEFGKYDVETLPECDDFLKVKGIRYSFHKLDFHDALEDMNRIHEKGYKLFVQPISTNSYTKIELKSLLDSVNKLNPYAVYIVDTQGSMFKDEFRKLYEVFESILNKEITIGFHSHNNMQLSYSIAIDFIEISKARKIIIDSSIYGMGRGAGNLNTELLADYINKKIEDRYNIEYLLELIDTYYYAIHVQSSWGYSLAHFLSASLECHPNYASYLLNKKHLSINEISNILKKIPKDNSFEYNKDMIDELYYSNYLHEKKKVIEPVFDIDRRILLVGSGSNIREKIDYIEQEKSHYTVIALNHKPKEIEVDYVFFNNMKRYEKFSTAINGNRTIVTTNMPVQSSYYLDILELTRLENMQTDSVVVMFINYLLGKGFKRVELAGIDGYGLHNNNYSYEENDKVIEGEALKDLNRYIESGLNALKDKIEIVYLTDSIFDADSSKRKQI